MMDYANFHAKQLVGSPRRSQIPYFFLSHWHRTTLGRDANYSYPPIIHNHPLIVQPSVQVPPMPISLTILDNPDPETLQREFSHLSKSFPYFRKVQYITTSSPTSPPIPQSHLRRSTTTTLLGHIRTSSSSYIHAIPSSQIHSEQPSNSLEYRNGKFTIILSQADYQKIPPGKNWIVKKLKHDKIGHGGSYQATYRYKLLIDSKSPEVEYLIKTIFGDVEMTTLVPGTGENGIHEESVMLLDDLKGELDDYEKYEYLTIVVNFGSDQIVQLEALSRFKLIQSGINGKKYTFIDIGSSWIDEIRDEMAWNVISIHPNDENHILLYRSNNMVYVWKATQ